ncbi:MAG: hypothetical protein AAF797_11875 [Planctomycetota bacterium]
MPDAMNSHCRITINRLVLLALTAVVAPATADGLTPHPDRPKLIFSEDTTYFTEPVTPDGTVDLFAALNRAGREGVDPQQNAVLRILPILPESDRDDEDLGPMAAALGLNLAEAHAQGPRLTAIPWGPRDDDGPFVRASKGPWKLADLPEVADWLEDNRAALQALDAAVRLPQSYWPIVPSDPDSLILEAHTPGLRQSRVAGRALVLRIHADWGEGEHGQAIHGVESLMHLGQHLSNQPSLIGSLVAISIRSLSASAVGPLLNDPQIPADAARQLLAVIQNRSEMRPVASAMSTYERAIALDVFQAAYAQPDRLGDGIGTVIKFAARSPMFDINLALKELNRSFDRVEQVARLQTFAEVRPIAEKIEADLQTQNPLLMGDAEKPLRQRFTLHTVRTAQNILMPALAAAATSELMHRSREELLLVASALTVYRVDHGQYPKQLAELVPDYLTKLPLDRYDGRPLTYKPGDQNQTYLLYSVGQNGKDDQGAFDYREGDISIGNPLPEGW